MKESDETASKPHHPLLAETGASVTELSMVGGITRQQLHKSTGMYLDDPQWLVKVVHHLKYIGGTRNMYIAGVIVCYIERNFPEFNVQQSPAPMVATMSAGDLITELMRQLGAPMEAKVTWAMTMPQPGNITINIEATVR